MHDRFRVAYLRMIYSSMRFIIQHKNEIAHSTTPHTRHEDHDQTFC